jgi:hypothetical protein
VTFQTLKGIPPNTNDFHGKKFQFKEEEICLTFKFFVRLWLIVRLRLFIFIRSFRPSSSSQKAFLLQEGEQKETQEETQEKTCIITLRCSK